MSTSYKVAYKAYKEDNMSIISMSSSESSEDEYTRLYDQYNPHSGNCYIFFFFLLYNYYLKINMNHLDFNKQEYIVALTAKHIDLEISCQIFCVQGKDGAGDK